MKECSIRVATCVRLYNHSLPSAKLFRPAPRSYDTTVRRHFSKFIRSAIMLSLHSEQPLHPTNEPLAEEIKYKRGLECSGHYRTSIPYYTTYSILKSVSKFLGSYNPKILLATQLTLRKRPGGKGVPGYTSAGTGVSYFRGAVGLSKILGAASPLHKPGYI